MESQRFAAITRAWSRRSRRRVLTSLTGTALGALATTLARVSAAATCTAPRRRCSSDDQCCGSKNGKTACRHLTNVEICRTGRRCCALSGTKCIASCDCCGTLFCGSGGTCET